MLLRTYEARIECDPVAWDNPLEASSGECNLPSSTPKEPCTVDGAVIPLRRSIRSTFADAEEARGGDVLEGLASGPPQDGSQQQDDGALLSSGRAALHHTEGPPLKTLNYDFEGFPQRETNQLFWIGSKNPSALQFYRCKVSESQTGHRPHALVHQQEPVCLSAWPMPVRTREIWVDGRVGGIPP